MTDTRLFELLPTVYRLRDAERGGPLEALIDLISGEVDLLRDDLSGLWDDLFVETCSEWVVPYVGDLVANTPLYEIPGVGRRADVARTIHWRRRKGTLAMLGDLARHVTGWGVNAVATFEWLSWNQNLNHLRMQVAPDDPGGRHPSALDRVGTVDVRHRDGVDRIGTAFDMVGHTADVHAISDDGGWYGLRKVCFFCFRLQSFPMVGMTVAPSASGGAGCFHLHPLSQDAPVFHLGVPVPTDDFAQEANVDAPIRPFRFYERPAVDWGRSDTQTLVIDNGGTDVPVTDVICKDLSAWANVPPDKVGVDVRTGRIRFGSAYAVTEPVRVNACYGFSAPIGGGPYRRGAAAAAAAGPLMLYVPSVYPDIKAAVDHWRTLPPQDVRIVILDSATYALPAGGLDLSWPALGTPVGLTIASEDKQRPLLVGDVKVGSTPLRELALEGVMLSGKLSVAGPVRAVTVTDSTLVPGIALGEDGLPQHPDVASLSCDEPADRREVTLERSITGPLRLPPLGNHLAVRDGIVDAPSGAASRVAIAADDPGGLAGPESVLERVTVLGAVHVRELTLASDCIFVGGTVKAERRQAGCMRYSSLPLAGAQTPRRYRCQPDLVRAAAPDAATADREELRVRPTFTSSLYGQPAYMQLGRSCATEIRQGGDAGTEMGAFQMLLQPYRETNLRVRLDEYLPFGLEPGIVHVT